MAAPPKRRVVPTDPATANPNAALAYSTTTLGVPPGTTPNESPQAPADPYGTPTGQVGNQPVYYDQPQGSQRSTPGERVSATPTSTNNQQWGNTDEAYLREQVKRVFSQYGREPTEAEYQQWAGPSGYMRQRDVDGTGKELYGWDPYWEMRLGYHARDEDYGGGVDQMRARQAAGIQDYGFGSTASATQNATANVGWQPTAGGGSMPASHPAASNRNGALYQQRIAELLNTSQTVDPEALANTPEAQAAALTRQRSEERQRSQLMERAAVDGYSGGAVESTLQGIRQDAAEGEIGLMATLASQKMQQNREALIQGIQFAMSDNQFEQAQALQRQLAELDASIQRQSITAGQGEGAAQRALQRELGLLGIGYNYDALGANLNQQATIAALDRMGYN